MDFLLAIIGTSFFCLGWSNVEERMTVNAAFPLAAGLVLVGMGLYLYYH